MVPKIDSSGPGMDQISRLKYVICNKHLTPHFKSGSKIESNVAIVQFMCIRIIHSASESISILMQRKLLRLNMLNTI